MSRIGLSPISLPDGVEIDVSGSSIVAKGPKGELRQEIDERITFTIEDGVVTLSRANEERETRALHGLSRALVNNMVLGVANGFSKELQMIGVGYRAQLQGNRLQLQVGFSHPVNIEAPDGITFELPEPTKIVVRGIDKQKVGQAAAVIRRVRPPEPYKGKGIRYVDEYVRRRTGKTVIS